MTPVTAADARLARKPVPVILLLSAMIAGALIWLIYFKGKVAEPGWVHVLPFANAVFNSCSAVCLVLGYVQIRKGRRIPHLRCMLSATVFSTLFLVSYIVYHYFHGDTRFPGHGVVRGIYLSILASHILLSMVALPLILGTLWFALTTRFQIHRRVARWTFPIWLYVSVTGVIVFLMLKSYTA